MCKPWYADGLRFECTRCGNCCRTQGDHAYVYVMPPEVTVLADRLGLSEGDFTDLYCVEDEGWLVLRMDLPHCPFLTGENACEVHSARPRQCRTWPFWEENLSSELAWKAAALICPGIGTGPRVEWQEIREIARANEEWYEGGRS